MAGKRRYSDKQLAGAVAISTSWRGVLRELGLAATSASAMRSVRSHADELGIDYRHFRGQRGCSEDDLRAAVAAAGTWLEVAEQLRLRDRTAIAFLKGHAARLGLDVAHLPAPPPATADPPQPDLARLDRAGSMLAAAWFTLCGNDVSWPLEPGRYDLLVSTAAGIRRVQVKTTTARAGRTWKVYLSTCRHGRTAYTPEEIDDFFVIDGDLGYYLIPLADVGGLHALHLSAYQHYRLPRVPVDRRCTA